VGNYGSMNVVDSYLPGTIKRFYSQVHTRRPRHPESSVDDTQHRFDYSTSIKHRGNPILLNVIRSDALEELRQLDVDRSPAS
jgi:hypothetical protein